MHGYIDSFPVPMHLSAATASNSTGSKSSKGKGKEKQQQSADNGSGGKSAIDMYDVVANWTAQERLDVERRIAMAARLGYSTIVLTLTIWPTTNPATLVFPTPLVPEIDPRTAAGGAPTSGSGMILQLWRIHVADYSDEAVKGASQKGYYGFSNSTASLFPPSISLLSVTPTTLTTFSHVALTLSPPSLYSPTTIILDPSISPRLPFPLKRGLAHSLARAGVVFEIIYRGITKQDEPGVGGNTAGQRRRNWIAGAREIVRACGAKGVILSSGASKEGEMRAPEDLINLCSLIGLTAAQAKDALTLNPARAIARGLALRQTYRGILSNPSLVTTIHAADAGENTLAEGRKRAAQEDAAELEGSGSKKAKTVSG